jgi:drug/metabolite transporter (DMT)-like permease
LPTPINRMMTPAEWALLITLALLWGGSYFYIAVAVRVLPPFTIVAFRVTVAGALLYLAVRATGHAMPRDGASWRAYFVMGFLNNVVPFSLIAWAQSHVESGLAAILNATTPLFAVVLAHYLTGDERMTKGSIAGIVIGFSGVVVMIGPDALNGLSTDLMAELALLAASVFYALSPIYARRFGRAGHAPIVSAAGQFASSAAMMVPLALFIDRPWTLPLPGVDVWAALIALATLSSAVAYIIYYRVLKTAGAVNLMLVTFLVPVSAILLGAVILHERLALADFAGMALIGLGLAAIDGRPLRLLTLGRAQA